MGNSLTSETGQTLLHAITERMSQKALGGDGNTEYLVTSALTPIYACVECYSTDRVMKLKKRNFDILIFSSIYKVLLGA